MLIQRKNYIFNMEYKILKPIKFEILTSKI